MSRHPIGEHRAVRSDAIAPKTQRLAVLLLTLLAIAGCSGRLAPVAGRAEPSATSPTTSLPVARTSTPTSIPATPTVRKPTATFVPLPTPPPTPEGSPTKIVVPRINVELARQMASAGDAVLVDVRTRATFAQAHIAGALSMPAEEILVRLHELPTDRLIIFYCA